MSWSSRVLRGAVAACAVGFGLGVPPTLLACSICRCGDPTFNALGKEGYAVRGLRVAFDWERFSKTEGDPQEEFETQVEHRLTALASYGLSERLAVYARVPYSVRDLAGGAPGEEPESVHTNALSDPEFYAQWRLWGSGMTGGLGRRTSLSLVGGVKTAWGRNELADEGVRLDEHAQSGTGSTDVFGSLAVLHLIDKQSALFASGGYRHTGENASGYRYGSTVLANVAYEHRLGRWLDGVAELNFRHAANDRVDAGGERDRDTGGALLYATPRLLADLGGGLVLRAAVQIPLLRDLNGFQEERAVVNVGLTYLFSH
jgi:hypothetical protein